MLTKLPVPMNRFGCVSVLNDKFVLFGVGKRDCVGRSVAIKALFAIFGLMMTKYKFIANNNKPNEMDIKQEWGLSISVQPPIPINLDKRHN